MPYGDDSNHSEPFASDPIEKQIRVVSEKLREPQLLLKSVKYIQISLRCGIHPPHKPPSEVDFVAEGLQMAHEVRGGNSEQSDGGKLASIDIDRMEVRLMEKR